jgi:hypothetical protein
MIGLTERSDWSGTDQPGHGVHIGCQTQRFDWSGKRSVLIGRAPTNLDAEFLAAVKKEPFDWSGERSVLIGREPTNQNAPIGRFQTKQSS